MQTELSFDDVKNKGFFDQTNNESLSTFLVTGADATRYLHGRLTQNIKSLAHLQSCRALLLQSNGKISGVTDVIKLSDGYLLVADCSIKNAESFTSALLQFKVSDDILVSASNKSVISVAGKEAFQILHLDWQSALTTQKGVETALGNISLSAYALPIENIPLANVIVDTSNVSALAVAFCAAGISPLSALDFDAMRILGGTPRMYVDISDRTNVADLPIARFASFTKGCYVGQEVVEMASARGRANRRWAQLIAQSPVAVEAEAVIMTADSSKAAGAVTSSCVFTGENTTICLGFISNSLPSPAEVNIAGTLFQEAH